MPIFKVIWILTISSWSISAITFPLTHESISEAPPTVPGTGSIDESYKPAATESKPKKNPKNCEKVIKNGMLCLVCSDEENGTSEQCAFLSHPPKKYSGPKKPRPEPDIDELTPKFPKNKRNKKFQQLRRYDESSEGEDSSNYSADFDGFGDYYPEYTSKSEKLSKAESNDCEEQERDDGTVCLICKDPKNGGSSQRCRHAYQPKEKVYGYSRSRSFGSTKEPQEPKERKEPKKNGKKKKPQSAEKSQSYRRKDNGAEDKDLYGFSSSHGYSEQEEPKEHEYGGQSRESRDGNCHEVERDGMICTVCVNPKTNGKSEQCSYSYKPEDELFAYSNKKSYGSPKNKRR